MPQRTERMRSILRLVLASGAAALPACAELSADDGASNAALSTGTGLQADYFNNQTLTAPAALRRAIPCSRAFSTNG